MGGKVEKISLNQSGNGKGDFSVLLLMLGTVLCHFIYLDSFHLDSFEVVCYSHMYRRRNRRSGGPTFIVEQSYFE